MMHTLARSVLIGGVVMAAIAGTVAMGRGPVPAHTFRDKPFQDDVWREDMATLALTSARLEALNMPKLVQTESIKPIERDPLMMALSTEPMAAAPLPRRKAAVVASDICAQHNLRKVYDGPRWRCRK
jgi:hypothetical protein